MDVRPTKTHRRRVRIYYSWLAIAAALVHPRLQHCAAAPSPEPTVHMVIVFPGGPEPEGDGRRIIGQFLGTVAACAGVDTNRLAGAYFTDECKAVEYVRANGSVFIMGSLSFFLANRESLDIEPLAKIVFPEDTEDCYRVVVKKGSYKSLEELKGKTIAGNTLFCDPTFLTRIIFGNRVDATNHFVIKPTSRPLSALRRVASGRMDAVLLNQVQYRSLAMLPLLDELDVVHESIPLPPLGFMRAGRDVEEGLSERLVKAVVELPKSEAGKEACENFALKGFVPVADGELLELIGTYEANTTQRSD